MFVAIRVTGRSPGLGLSGHLFVVQTVEFELSPHYRVAGLSLIQINHINKPKEWVKSTIHGSHRVPLQLNQ
jgi:hypothetical protein